MKTLIETVPDISSPGIPRISAVLITNNNGGTIRRTLARLTWCNEIVVVDGYSKDNTVAICREFNCIVYLKSFEGYGPQKRYAVSKTRNHWVLYVEPEEVLPEGLSFEIQQQLGGHSRYTGFSLPISLVFFNKQFLYGKESWHYQLRLFDKRYGDFTDSAINEKINLKGRVGKLRNRMLNRRFSELADWERWGDQLAAFARAQGPGGDYGRLRLAVMLGMPLHFLKYYFLHLNFLNGLEGFYWSALNAGLRRRLGVIRLRASKEQAAVGAALG